MMKKTTILTTMAVLAALALPAGAADYVRQLGSAAVRKVTSAVRERSLSDKEKETRPTEFGKRLVEALRSQDLPLPMEESEMLKLKAGNPKKAAATQAMPEIPVTFTGFCQFSATPEGYRTMKYGVYSFSTEDNLVRKNYKDVDFCVNGSGAYIGHRFYGMSNIPMPIDEHMYERWYMAEYDTDLWTPTGNHKADGYPAWGYIMRCTAFDEADGITYAYNGYGDFMKIDYVNFTEAETVTEEVAEMSAIAIHPSTGVMYGVTRDGDFCSIDKSNGVPTILGHLDFDYFQALQSMTFDKRTGKLYFIAPEMGPDYEIWSSLRELNLEDGSTNWFAYMPECEEYTCLNIIYPADGAAPADISDLRMEWPEAGREGNVAFTMPSETIDGTALSGDVEYSIYLNDNDASPVKGSAAAGSEVNQAITAPADGYLKVVVVLASDGNEGNRNAIASWAGEDLPMARDLSFEYDEESLTATISWTNPTVGANGGFVNPDNVTYNVVRCPGDVKVAEKTHATSVTDDLSECEYDGYYYVVTAYDGDRKGKEVSTDIRKIGRGRSLPYAPDFSDEKAGDAFTIIDGNGDGETFKFQPWWNEGVFMSEYAPETGSDEWLISPALRLEEGMTYNLTLAAGSFSQYRPDMYSVSFGTGSDVTSYKDIVAPTMSYTDYYGGTLLKETLLLVPDKTGDYHVAIHHCTPGDEYGNAIVVSSFEMTEGLPAAVPAVVTRLAATAAEDGELEATVTFTAPLLTVGGTELSSLSKIEVYRDDEELIGTVENARPGETYTVTDSDAYNGNLKYTVVAYNSYGAGAKAEVNAYVGIDQPTAPINVTLTDNLDGTATLTWEAPQSGVHGGMVDADDLYYNVMVYDSGRWTTFKSEVDETSCVVSAPVDSKPAFLFYAVTAVNDLGASELAEADALPVGKAYAIPYIEGFAGGNMAGIWYPSVTSEDMEWGIYSGISADGDNFVMGLDAEANGVGTLTSGKISLAGAASPKLCLAFLHEAEYDNSVEIYVRKDGGAAEKVFSYNFSDDEDTFWKIALIDLDKYKDGSYINVIIKGIVEDEYEEGRFFFDDLSVRDVPACNLELALSAPSRMLGGKDAEATVTLHNVGMNDAKDYKVELYVDGMLATTAEIGETLMPFDRAQVGIKFNASPAADNVEVKALLVYSPDMIDSDNESDVCKVSVYAPLYEAPANLRVEEGMLAWDAVTGDGAVTESFEAYPAFDMNGFGDWTVEDGDGGNNFNFLASPYPGKGQPGSFFTVNFVDLGADSTNTEYTGHTGEQFAACARPNSGFNDDWMISPELSGEAQTITLWVRSQQEILGADFEVMASYEGNAISDFTLVDSFSDISGEWQEYSVDLPAGTKYFAIHCATMMGGLLQVDDVTFCGKKLTLMGYNVYCDGKLVGNTASDVTAVRPSAIGNYCVTAVYAEGESDASNRIDVTETGVGTLLAKGMNVRGGIGEILFSGIEGHEVTVCNADGVCILSSGSMDQSRVAVLPGVYVVSVDKTPVKVIVK